MVIFPVGEPVRGVADSSATEPELAPEDVGVLIPIDLVLLSEVLFEAFLSTDVVSEMLSKDIFRILRFPSVEQPEAVSAIIRMKDTIKTFFMLISEWWFFCISNPYLFVEVMQDPHLSLRRHAETPYVIIRWKTSTVLTV